jgi:hypothetical protein
MERWLRIGIFLKEMFPPAIMVPVGVAKFYAVYLLLQAMGDSTSITWTWRSICGALTLVGLLLLARVYDELKDYDADKALAAAGDPRYMGRPLVRGAVLLEDVLVLRRTLVIVMWGLQLVVFHWLSFAAFAFAFGVMWWSSRWFGWPAISKSLLLAFATHNPMTLTLLLYAASVYVADFGMPLDANAVPLLIALWLPLAAWETSRKIRISADETAYQTYTKVLGQKLAMLPPSIFVLLTLVCLLQVAAIAELPIWYRYLVVIAALVPLVGYARFVLFPSRQSAKLQPLTEFFGLVVDVGLPLAVIVG